MFDERWKNVIDPAIRGVERNNVPLEPQRVDIRQVSDSILTEILTGISRSLVVFADVTSLGEFENRPVRNSNVMYEVGLAHAIRMPEEVILFRSDNEELLFDIANVRVNSYDPDGDPENALRKVGTTIVEAIKEIDLKKNLSVKAAAESLDHTCLEILLSSVAKGGVYPPQMKTVGQALANVRHLLAISRLLELGALKTNYFLITPGLFADLKDQPIEKIMKYELTQFGNVLIEHIASEMGVLSPKLKQNIKQLLEYTNESTK